MILFQRDPLGTRAGVFRVEAEVRQLFFFSLGFSSFFLPPPRFDVFAFLLLLLLLLLYLLLFLVPLSQHHVV